MAAAVYGAASRRPVYSGNRRVPGLYERTLAGGATVYEAALRLGGRVRRHRLEAGTKTDAINELRALQVDYERGEQGRSPAAALTVAELADDWLDHLRARVGHRDPRRRVSARTVDLYEQRLRSHIRPRLGSRIAADVTVAEVRRLVDELGHAKLAPATVTGIVNTLSGLFRFAVKGGQVERNPVRDLDRDDRPGTARTKQPRYLTVDELERLLGEMSDTFRPVVFVCLYAGLRISEALGLLWRDIDLNAGTLTVSAQLGTRGDRVPPKTPASSATVPLLPVLARELRSHRARSARLGLRRAHAVALVFTTSRGRPQSRRNALRAIHKAGDAAGLNDVPGRKPVGLHDMRQSFVSLGFAFGGQLPEVSKLARHADPRVTAQMYAGLTDRGLEEAAARLVKAGFGS